jgi:hypothetical protein
VYLLARRLLTLLLFLVRFNILLLHILYYTIQNVPSCLSKMKEWDKVLATRIAKSLRASKKSMIIYKLLGNTSGIALNSDNIGFGRVELITKINDETKVALLGVLVAQFGPDSFRLQKVSWATLEDHLE